MLSVNAQSTMITGASAPDANAQNTMVAGSATAPVASEDPAAYWWPVCGGEDILRAFHAAPEHEAWSVVQRYPVLLMPELVDAAERVLGRTRPIEGLREMHRSLRTSSAYAPYQRLLVAALIGQQRGSRRVNLERALAVLRDVRRLAGRDPVDDRVEQTIRAELKALSKTPPPRLEPPAMNALFLDEGELAGFQRGKDRRGNNPNLHDRAFATQGGLTAGACEWLGDPAAPVYRIVDARWVFASTKAARAYLDSPGTQLLARDGLQNPAVLKIADGAHAWGTARSPGGRERHCVLFRVERVVAKLDVTEGPHAAAALQRLTRAQLIPYAEVIVRRVRRVLAEYWLAIGNGTVAAQKLAQASPRTADRLLPEYPILLLPEFPTAMVSLGNAYRATAEKLVLLQGAARNQWRSYRELLRALVRTLLDEPAGEPRINADAALRLVSAHRLLDSDPSWTALEAECSARAAGTDPPSTASPNTTTTTGATTPSA
jgi:hypothetical protein